VITVVEVLDMFKGIAGKSGNKNVNLYDTVTTTLQPGLLLIVGQVFVLPMVPA
jgi:hypothetical protein